MFGTAESSPAAYDEHDGEHWQVDGIHIAHLRRLRHSDLPRGFAQARRAERHREPRACCRARLARLERLRRKSPGQSRPRRVAAADRALRTRLLIESLARSRSYMIDRLEVTEVGGGRSRRRIERIRDPFLSVLESVADYRDLVPSLGFDNAIGCIRRMRDAVLARLEDDGATDEQTLRLTRTVAFQESALREGLWLPSGRATAISHLATVLTWRTRPPRPRSRRTCAGRVSTCWTPTSGSSSRSRAA